MNSQPQPKPKPKPKLTLFDLDHTLLHGDSDQLWCDFLVERGVLPYEPFATHNADMARNYAAGRATAADFCNFYIGTLAGRSAAEWGPLRGDWFRSRVAPRIAAPAQALVARHRQAGDRLVLSTATCRFLSEPSAAFLGIADLIATECEVDTTGRFSGHSQGTLNMRDGKVTRLHAWLAQQGLALDAVESRLYSDSINDLPLLSAVNHAVVVDADPQLAAEAARRGWPALSLQ